MDMLILLLGAVLTILFFLNIKNAADILCRIVGGFALLLIYNAAAPHFSLSQVGINLLSALLTGTMGAPGAALLVCAAIFL